MLIGELFLSELEALLFILLKLKQMNETAIFEMMFPLKCIELSINKIKYRIFSCLYILESGMNSEDDNYKLNIHQILNRHKFYRLPLSKYLQILRLIQMPEARQAKNIQQNMFTGIRRLTESLKLPINNSRLTSKKYFNPQIEKNINAQVKDYVTLIIDDYIAYSNSKEIQSTLGARKDMPLYQMMPFNTVAYANPIDYTTAPKDSSNIQLQMYYMNMYNYGNHPQMNLNEPYSTFPKQPLQKQEKQAQKGLINQQMKKIEQSVVAANEPQDKQAQIEPLADMQVEIKAEQNGNMSNYQARLIQPEIQQQFSINKSPQIEIGFFSPIINPQSQHNLNHRQMKLISNEVQIQTDLCLLNQEIQVFPRENMPIQKTVVCTFIGKKLNQSKRKRRQRQRQMQKQQLQKIIQVHNTPQLPPVPPKKEIKQYTVIVRKEYLHEDLPRDQYQTQELPSLKNKSSQFERLQRKMSIELSSLKKEVNLQQSLRNCPCKGTIKSDDTFQCLACKRTFHKSCLKFQNFFDVQQCHICKLQKYETTTEAKECIKYFYTTDIKNERIEVEISITQYEYFLFRKIRHHEIELRCCKLNDLQNFEMIWPEFVAISINRKPAVQIQGANLRKRKDAIIVTQFIIQGKNECLDETAKIKIKFDFHQWNKNNTQVGNGPLYIIGIYFVEKIEFQTFIEKYSKNIGCFQSNYTTKLMDINNVDGDDGVEIQKLICNLYDPFTRSLINTPVRGSSCIHLQCFDLRNYLIFMYATKSRLWKCPICSKDSNKLLLDRQFKQLIRKSVASKTIPKEITFMKDGNIELRIVVNQDSDQETPPRVQQVKKKYVSGIKKTQKNSHPKKQEHTSKI